MVFASVLDDDQYRRVGWGDAKKFVSRRGDDRARCDERDKKCDGETGHTVDTG